MNIQIDIFGNEVYIAPTCSKRGRNSATPRGHAMPPGTGPEGKTCRSCKHKCGQGTPYLKCGLNRAIWTHGRKTDILASDPACKKWEAKDDK